MTTEEERAELTLVELTDAQRETLEDLIGGPCTVLAPSPRRRDIDDLNELAIRLSNALSEKRARLERLDAMTRRVPGEMIEDRVARLIDDSCAMRLMVDVARQAQEQIEALGVFVKELTWHRDSHGTEFCRMCGSIREYGHLDDCKILTLTTTEGNDATDH